MLLAALLLAACGGGDSGIEGGADTGNVSTAAAEGKPSGTLSISNWPFYIDNQTVPDFEKATGISVKYQEDVNDNSEFFGKMQPLLDQGESGGRDIMVVTDWMANKMHNLGYLQDFDQEAVKPAMDNLVPSLQSPSFDPDRSFSLPWQSGMTGLVVNTAEAPDVKSVNDLFDPQYKGQVEMLTEMRDTVPLVMKADGVDPTTATKQDWLDAIDKIKEASDSRSDPQVHRQQLHQRPRQRRCGGGDRLVRRRDPAAGRQPGHQVRDAGAGLHDLVRQHGHPGRGAEPDCRLRVDELRLRAEEPGSDHGLQLLLLAGRGGEAADSRRPIRRPRRAR